MNKMSLIDKLRILVEVSKSSIWFLVLIVLLIGYGFVLFKTRNNNKKRNRRIYMIFSIIVSAILLIVYRSSISHLFNYLIDNVFISLMFPNIAIYFLGIIITNVILWISLFYYQTSNTIKRINIIVYLILNYLLALIISTIDINKVDVFSESSLYHNNKVTALIELSTLIFVVWIIYLILYKIILVYVRKDYKEKIRKVVVRKEVKKLPINYSPTKTPDYIFGTPGKRITIVETDPNRFIQNYEQKLTLNDYRLLLKILKEEKAKKNMPSIDLNNEKIVEMKKQEKQREEEKYTELEMLFRGIR